MWEKEVIEVGEAAKNATADTKGLNMDKTDVKQDE